MAAKSEVPDLAVDDLRRRARRRLVGAVVVALAAAVTLPMLLESDPRPLGDDVSIQIPPIDNSKFVTPLSPAPAPDKGPPARPVADAKSDIRPAPAVADPTPAATPPPPKRGLVEAEQRVLGQTPSKPGTPAPPSAKSSQATETNSMPATEAARGAAETVAPVTTPPAAAVGQSVATADAAAPDGTKAMDAGVASAKPTSPTSAKANATGAFQVQLAAFTDAKLASDLAKKVSTAGFPAHTEDVPTQQGSVHRVRVGPYATRSAADTAMSKLKAIGFDSAQVVATK
jgi:DedD protein